jgi:hypothetical protein
MAKAISYEKLQKVRSGQTVYRVWGWPLREGGFHVYVTKMQFIGKRTKNQKAGYGKPDFVFKNRNGNKPLNDGLQTYINSAEGIRCFDTLRKANKYIAEVKMGFHQIDLRKCAKYHEELDILDSYFEQPYGDYPDIIEYL